MEVSAERLSWLERISLSYGSHKSVEAGSCIMEAVAFVAGEPHSDAPKCACPVVSAFCRRINDRWAQSKGGAERVQKLKPYVLRLVGSKSTPEVERKRAYLAADWAVRTILPMALEAPRSKAWKEKMGEWPAKLRALPEIVDKKSAEAGRDMARKARSAYAAAAADAAADAAAAYAAAAYAAAAADAYYAAADAYADDAARVSADASTLDLLDRMLSVSP